MRRYFYLTLLLLAFILIFWYSAKFQSSFYSIVDFLKAQAEVRPVTSVAVFVLFAAVSAMFSPFSSVPLVPPAILIWGNSLTFLLLLIGWLCGGILTYLAGFYGINPVLKKFVDLDGKIRFYQDKLSRRTELWLVLLFRLAMPAEVPGYVLGIVRYNFGWYFFATLVSELVFALATVYGSEAILEKRLGLLLMLGVAMLAFFAGMLYLFSRALKQRRRYRKEVSDNEISRLQ
ncbi:VTT domain-containing protein [Candidatus Uhrbacteria bacterium]|nr:VTT domain-containing protein [Candidatus Uhrbacteria bacterium]